MNKMFELYCGKCGHKMIISNQEFHGSKVIKESNLITEYKCEGCGNIVNTIT